MMLGGRLAGVLVVVAVLAGSACTDSTLKNVIVELHFADSAYSPTDTLYGTFKFINIGPDPVRHEFSSGYQYGIRLCDKHGDWRLVATNDGATRCAVTYLELEPYGIRTDHIEVHLWDPDEPPFDTGRYRVRGSVAGREDVHDETTITLR
jgi:hypothetical protein